MTTFDIDFDRTAALVRAVFDEAAAIDISHHPLPTPTPTRFALAVERATAAVYRRSSLMAQRFDHVAQHAQAMSHAARSTETSLANHWEHAL